MGEVCNENEMKMSTTVPEHTFGNFSKSSFGEIKIQERISLSSAKKS
jgi:hypothetical protein